MEKLYTKSLTSQYCLSTWCWPGDRKTWNKPKTNFRMKIQIQKLLHSKWKNCNARNGKIAYKELDKSILFKSLVLARDRKTWNESNKNFRMKIQI